MSQQRLIGILGGLGPEAGRLLQGYITEESMRQRTIRCDQDHCDVIHLSLPSLIPDRASYIFDQSQPNPTPIIYKILMSMKSMAELYGRALSVCIPCNTYHAPVLFDPLQDMLAQDNKNQNVRILNLIDESAQSVKKLYPRLTHVGLISTSGERKSNIYRHYLNLQGIDIIQADEHEQQFVDDAIYNPVYGLKATSQGTPIVREMLRDIVLLLQQRGAEVIILGCTELPFVFDQENFSGVQFLSPMRVIAKRLIEDTMNG